MSVPETSDLPTLEDLDTVETLFVLTGVCPTRQARKRYEVAGYRLRRAFECAVRANDMPGAAAVIEAMERQTSAIIWCVNARRRLAHLKARQTARPSLLFGLHPPAADRRMPAKVSQRDPNVIMCPPPTRPARPL